MVVVTHTTRSLALCDKVAVMSRGGELAFFGSPDDALRFFEVDSPSSQEEKLRRVRAVKDYPVDAAKYVACDFEKNDFVAADRKQNPSFQSIRQQQTHR